MMKNFALVVLGTLLWIFTATAQTGDDAKINNLTKNSSSVKSSISGIITDAKTNAPLPGATIFLPDLKKGAIADDKGYFHIASVNSGKYLIEISYQGFASVIENIEISGETVRNYSLQPTVVEQEAVTVTGVSFATRTKQNPQPVSIVKHDDLLNAAFGNIMDALAKTVPGLSVLTTGPAISKPFIRGLGYNRVVTVNDGVRQEGQQWGDEHGIEIDDYSAQRVEVLKGPASLMYGSDAIAGVINIQSQLPAPEGNLRVNFESEYQTNNRLRGFYGNIGGTKNGFSWNAYGDYKGAPDYKNKYDGYVFNSKFYNKNFGGMVGYSGSWGSSKILLTSFDQHLGIVEGDRDETTGQFIKPLPGGEEGVATNTDFKKIIPEVPFQHIRHFKLTSDNTFNIGKNRLDLVVGFQRNQRQEFGNANDTNTPNAYFDLKTMNYALRFHLPSAKNFKTSFGVNGMYQTNTNRAAEVIIPNYNLFDAGVFIYNQYTKDKLSLSGGLRFDNRHVEGKSMIVDGMQKFNRFAHNFSNVSGSVGLAYQASEKTTLKMNFARGFRAPNFAELASNGAHEGTNRYEVGNTDLKSEVSVQADAGIEIASEHVSLSASVFYNNISNFIFYEKLANSAGQDSIIHDAESGNDLNVYRFDQHNAHLYGAEFHVDIHPHPLDWLHFENTFSYTIGRFNTALAGTTNLPFIPAARLVSELRGNFFSKGKSLKNLYISVSDDYTFKQNNPFTGYNTETATGSYVIVNAAVGTEILNKGKQIFSIHLSASNLGDAAYQNHLSRLKYTSVNNVTGRQGVYEMGRNFSIKINVPLTFKI
ncbi:MAG TPA: TonB-dependent receptor [Panacibacter sp.]|nr:TonB-dependent receptor [Panacibacter sp.]